MRTSRSDVQLELRIDGLACRHPAHGRRSAGRSLLAVRCSTNPTAVVPHDVARTSDIDFTRQKGDQSSRLSWPRPRRFTLETELHERRRCDLARSPNVKADQHTLSVR